MGNNFCHESYRKLKNGKVKYPVSARDVGYQACGLMSRLVQQL